MRNYTITLPFAATLLLCGVPQAVMARNASLVTAAPSREQATSIDPSEEQQSRDWGLRAEEWVRYRELMRGPLGTYSPNLDPLTALGVEARSDEERRRYAELQVRAESRRVEKLLAYQRAYDAAWQRLTPGAQRVSLPDASVAAAPTMTREAARTAVFVKDDCAACNELVGLVQASGAPFDLYMVGSLADDARIRDWARRARIDPGKVRSGHITLNHDAGRWLSLGLLGGLPAVVRQVGGQWQRQP